MANIAMVVFSYYPDDPRVRRSAEALSVEGHTVSVICLRNRNQKNLEIVNNVKIFRLPIHRKRGRKIRYIFEYFIFIVLAFFKLLTFCLKGKVDIVHVHNMPDILVFSSLVPKFTGAKVILDLHDPMPEVFMAKYSIDGDHRIIKTLLLLERLSINYADLVITPNIAFLDLFVSRGCPREKIHIVMNTPQENIFSPNVTMKIAPKTNLLREIVLMYHGTIVERHGLNDALKAVKYLSSRYKNIRLNVFGDGDYVDTFLSLRASLDLEDRVIFYGKVSLERISKEIESIDIGIIPNRKTVFTELNFPTRIFEYLCKSKPVIAPMTKGITDYFNTDSLFFFTPGDHIDLARAIEEVIENKEKVKRVLLKSIKVYKKNTWSFQKEMLLKIYNKIV